MYLSYQQKIKSIRTKALPTKIQLTPKKSLSKQVSIFPSIPNETAKNFMFFGELLYRAHFAFYAPPGRVGAAAAGAARWGRRGGGGATHPAPSLPAPRSYEIYNFDLLQFSLSHVDSEFAFIL